MATIQCAATIQVNTVSHFKSGSGTSTFFVNFFNVALIVQCMLIPSKVCYK